MKRCYTDAYLQFRIYPEFISTVCILISTCVRSSYLLWSYVCRSFRFLSRYVTALLSLPHSPSPHGDAQQSRVTSKLSNTSSSVQRFTYLFRFTQSTQSVCERTTHSFTIHIDPLCRITVRTRQSAPPNGLVANDANSPARTAQSQAQPQALLQDCHGPTLCPHCTQPRFWLAWTRLPW